MKYESTILKRLTDTYGVVGNPRYISEIIKELIVRGKESFPNLFTYQADWLAHIDEFGLNPSYTVSYTGQSFYAPNTLEKPVKSAILTGQTLMNISMINKFSLTNGNKNVRTYGKMIYGKKYLQIIAITKNTMTNSNNDVAQINAYEYNSNHNFDVEDTIASGFIGVKKLIGMASRNGKRHDTSIRTYSDSVGVLEGYEILIEYQEGMENWDIPYFEGMQSVKMPVLKTTGKNQTYPILGGDINSNEYNLMNLTDGNYNTNNQLNSAKAIKWVDNETFHIKGYGIDQYDNQYHIHLKPSLFKPNQKYRVSFKEISGAHERNDDLLTLEKFLIYINRKTVLTATQNNTVATFTTPDDIGELAFNIWLSGKKTKSDVIYAIFKEFMIEELENEQQPVSYEPYKSNILTVNEDVTLRGIGEVQDTLDCLTGELTQRIGEDVLDGSEDWIVETNENWSSCRFKLNKTFTPEKHTTDKIITNGKYIGGYVSSGVNTIRISNNAIYIFDTTFTTINEFKNYLQQNPLTMQYSLSTESIKTVDLNIKDQNNQVVNHLTSFEGGTHFNTTSSEGSPLPTVSVSVETDLEETLKICSLDGNTL